MTYESKHNINIYNDGRVGTNKPAIVFHTGERGVLSFCHVCPAAKTCSIHNSFRPDTYGCLNFIWEKSSPLAGAIKSLMHFNKEEFQNNRLYSYFEYLAKYYPRSIGALKQ